MFRRLHILAGRMALPPPLSAVLIVSTALMLSACMQSYSGSDSNTAEEYVYKGRIDQLTLQPAADRAAKLAERFKLVQARQ